MALYKYLARDKTGKESSGTAEAETEALLRDKITGMGMVVVSISPVSPLSIQSLNKIKFGTGVKLMDVAMFSRQFATMINAGLPLTKCLTILSSQTENEHFADILRVLLKDVESGLSLSEAMAKHRKVFPPIFISMVKAGELGGVLDEVLLRVAEHFERDIVLRGKIKSAMTYPVAMGVLVLGIAAAMLIFVVPTFEKMFSDMGGELPMLTQVMVAISNGMRGLPGLVAVVAVFVGFAAFKKATATGHGRYIWDAIKMRLPVIGGIVRKLALARFTRTFSTLVASGVPILQALEIVAETSGNEVVSREVLRCRSSIKEGEPIHKPLGESKVFPTMLVQMVAVGEETGALDSILAKVADFYDEEVSTTVEGLTSLIEPIMMAALGGTVGVMVVGLYLPMFGIISLVQGG